MAPMPPAGDGRPPPDRFVNGSVSYGTDSPGALRRPGQGPMSERAAADFRDTEDFEEAG